MEEESEHESLLPSDADRLEYGREGRRDPAVMDVNDHESTGHFDRLRDIRDGLVD